MGSAAAVRMARSRGAEGKWIRHLFEREVHLGFHRNVQAHLLHVAGYSGNSDPRPARLGISQFETLAERVLIGPKAAGHGFIDDRDKRHLRSVTLLENTTLAQRNA